MIQVIVAGDYCPINRVDNYVKSGEFGFILGDVRNLIKGASYAIANFECPIVDNDYKPIVKQGPCLKCHKENVEALKWAGFQCVTLANNHFKDYGGEGCISTITALEEGGLDYVGGGINLEAARKVLYKTIDGKTLAIVNFCENEFSIASSNNPGAAPLCLIDNYHQILEARSKSDYLMVIVHGGHEYYQLPSPRMKKTYRWFVDLGADVVINHHQHCYSGYEEYKGKPIFYGLGNFCFDGNRCGKDIWYEGYLVSLKFDNYKIEYSIIPYTQCREKPCISLMEEGLKDSFDEKIKSLNSVINDDIALENSFNDWCKQQFSIIGFSLTPYSNRFMRALWHRGLLPSVFPKKKMIGLLNRVQCEAHRDVMLYYLSNKVK